MSQEHHITGSHCWGQGASEGIREGAGTDLRHPFTLELACAVLHCSRHVRFSGPPEQTGHSTRRARGRLRPCGSGCGLGTSRR